MEEACSVLESDMSLVLNSRSRAMGRRQAGTATTEVLLEDTWNRRAHLASSLFRPAIRAEPFTSNAIRSASAGNAQCRRSLLGTPFIPHSLMQAFGESFSQAICDSLRHDRIVVVVLCPKPVAKFFQTDPASHRERTDMIPATLFPSAR